MFRLVRFLISLVFLATFIWFGATVMLGRHTLFGHVSRIWKSEPAQELRQGTKEKAQEIYDKARSDRETTAPLPTAPPRATARPPAEGTLTATPE